MARLLRKLTTRSKPTKRKVWKAFRDESVKSYREAALNSIIDNLQTKLDDSPTHALNSKIWETLKIADAAKAMLSCIADSNVILLLGGFTIAAALHRYEIDTLFASMVLKRAGRSPMVFALVSMIVVYLLSAFCNNIAGPVVVFFVINPLLQKCTDKKFAKMLVVSVAFGANVGGMPTFIASPQNAAASAALPHSGKDGAVSFLTFMGVAVPYSLVLLVISWPLVFVTQRLKHPADSRILAGVPTVRRRCRCGRDGLGGRGGRQSQQRPSGPEEIRYFVWCRRRCGAS